MKRDILVAWIRRYGPIPFVRVSSAQARGNAKNYAYWGAVRYELRLRKSDDEPVLVACERASSDRRSKRLAYEDARDIARDEGRFVL